MQNIWASWAVGRAGVALDNGKSERAVEILEAAVAAFPDNVTVKRTLAGGYLKAGRSRQALEIYKSLPNDNPSAADYEAEIGAALAANDKAQAESWLREALGRYPLDYRILGSAARFEQARGDNHKAAEYWKAALASMPEGSPADKLAHELAYPEEDTRPHKAHTAADLARLLNPDEEPFPRTVPLPPLPSYGPDPYLGKAPVVPAQQTAAAQSPYEAVPTVTLVPVPQNTATPASTAPLPAPPKHIKHAKQPAATGGQGTTTLPPPALAPAQPPATRPAVQYGNKPQSRLGVPFLPGTQPGGTGQLTAPVYLSNQPTAAGPTGTPSVQGIVAAQQATSPTGEHYDIQTGLRLAGNQPDDPSSRVAPSLPIPDRSTMRPASVIQVEAPIHPLENAQISLPSSPISAPAPSETVATATPSLEPVQYTPSAADAATGAYSAQQKLSPQQPPQAVPPPTPTKTAPAKTTRRKAAKRPAPEATETVPTLATAPSLDQQPSTPPPVEEQQAPAELSDEQLQERNLPPLRGPWVRVQREPRKLSPREEAELALRTLESSYSPWLGGTAIGNFRSGNPGYDRLVALEAPFEASKPLGYNARITVVAKPVFLNSGTADGTAVQVLDTFTTPNQPVQQVYYEPIGTWLHSQAETTVPTLPQQQNASGIGGEVQLALANFQVAVGHTPYPFLVSNWTGRVNWNPAGGPFTFSGSRDAVKDTQLSYAGLCDPQALNQATNGGCYKSNIWGGVVSNQGTVQYAHGDAVSGYYFNVGGQYLSGYQTQPNTRIDGDGGAYWRVWTLPEYGSLTVGANFFAMHYAHNESAYTWGMGGYFSPQMFFLAGVPITWTGHYGTRWHYDVDGALGIQAFNQDRTPLFPRLNANSAPSNLYIPALSQVGANYNFRTVVAHQIGEHWFVGGFLTANNTSNYNAASVGFSVHYLFRSQPSTVTSPTGLFPWDGFRPFRVP